MLRSNGWMDGWMLNWNDLPEGNQFSVLLYVLQMIATLPCTSPLHLQTLLIRTGNRSVMSTAVEADTGT